MSNTSVHKSSSKKAATADSDEEASQMSGEDHTQNVFSTDNSFEQNSTSNKKSGSKKVSSKKRSSRRKNSASDVDDDEEESEVGSLPEDEEILSSEESSSGSDDDDDDDDDEESSEDSSRDDDDDDWEKGSSKKKVSKKHAKSHKSAAKQTKPKVKAAKKASSKKTSVNKKQKGGENSKKRTISDVEDGEVSDNGHGSSSDASSVFNDGYDSDLIGDEEDRRKLDAMTEKEREEEIYRRTEQRDLLKKQFEMRKKLSRKQKEEARLKRHEEKKKTAKKSQKQVASSDDDHVQMRDNDLDDDDERNDESAQKQAAVEIMDRRKVNESKRKNTDVSKALANLKADREKKKQQAEDQRQKLQQQQQQKKLRAEDVFSSSSDEEKPSKSKHSQESSQKRHSSSEFSDESSDENESEMSSDENDEDDKNSKRSIEKKEDLNKIKLSRFRIEKWCHAPFFKDVACGCFVRIGIGLNQGVNIYRVAEVVEIVETAKVYSMGTTKTNKGFRLRHGREERIYRLEFVSNQPFTDDEFNRWKENMQKNNLPLPTMRQVENKGKELQSFINYRFKDEDLDHIIQEKKRFVKDTDKIADRKIALLKQREEAVQTNDPERVKEIDLLIEELNEKAIEVNTKRSGNFNLLAAINKRNRVTSNQMVEEAMRNEYARLQETKDDPFQRRKALPTLVAAIKKNTSSQELPKTDSQEKKKEEKKPEVAKKNPLKPPIPTFEDILAPTSLQKPIDETKSNQSILNFSAKISETIITTHGSNSTVHSDDLFQAHNFDININLSIPMPSNQIQTPQSYGNGTGVNNLSRRSLNLDEYKKKKGLI